MNIRPARPTVKGPAEWFTGDVWIDSSSNSGPATSITRPMGTNTGTVPPTIA